MVLWPFPEYDVNQNNQKANAYIIQIIEVGIRTYFS